MNRRSQPHPGAIFAGVAIVDLTIATGIAAISAALLDNPNDAWIVFFGVLAGLVGPQLGVLLVPETS